MWKDIPGYPGYQASEGGQIRSCNGRWSSQWQIMRLKPNGNRLSVNLHKDGKQYTHFVHHLVLWAFVGECPPGLEACHFDDDGNNNRLSNLRWDTHKSNIIDRGRNGNNPTGEKNPWAKLKVKQVKEVKKLHRQGERQCNIAKKTGIPFANVWAIIRGKSWRNI